MTQSVTHVIVRTNIGENPISHPARAHLADLTTPVSCGLAGLSLAWTRRKIRMTIFDEYPIASLSSLSPAIADEAAKILRDKIDDEMARLLARALDSKPIDIEELK